MTPLNSILPFLWLSALFLLKPSVEIKLVLPVIEKLSDVFVPDKAPSNLPNEPTTNLVNNESFCPGRVSVIIFTVPAVELFP